MPRSIVRPAQNGLDRFVLFIDALSSSSVFASIGMSTFSRLFIKIDIPPLIKGKEAPSDRNKSFKTLLTVPVPEVQRDVRRFETGLKRGKSVIYLNKRKVQQNKRRS